MPALVWMNGALNGCEMDTAFVSPLDLRAVPLAVTFDITYPGEATVVVPTPQIGGLMLDGRRARATTSALVPTRSDLTVISFSVSSGLHTVTCSSEFQLLVAAFGNGAGTLAFYQPFGAPCDETGAMCRPPDELFVTGNGFGCSASSPARGGRAWCLLAALALGWRSARRRRTPASPVGLRPH